MIQAPFPWFGGKSRVADQVWQRFGDVPNFVEPFFGSGAVLLGRPSPFGVETINDLDGFVANFWRSILHDPDAVAHWADWPVNECDLHARHSWLVSQRASLTELLMGDPDFCDPRIAGYWVWGLCSWIGSGWCSGAGPWITQDGSLVDSRQLPHLGTSGLGINRQLPHLGTSGMGINRQRPHLGHSGRLDFLQEWFGQIALRLRDIRVCCGDWMRVMGDSVTIKHGITGVFLDPPYAVTAGRSANLYALDSPSVAHQAREWSVSNGGNPMMRIALCGYEGEHVMPDSWECLEWSSGGGYESQSKTANVNQHRERIWFSPACLKPAAGPAGLFDDTDEVLA